MSAASAINPLAAPVYAAIAAAPDAHVLLRVVRVTIPQCRISGEEKADLQRAVRARFAQLNRAAVGEQKARW